MKHPQSTVAPEPQPAVQTAVVRPMNRRDEDPWNEYVSAHPDGTFFHLAQWKRVLESVFRHPTHYLLAETNGRVTGLLPLGQVRSRFFGNSLISTPFCVYGGILASDEPSRKALESAACALAERLGVDYLEMRNRRRLHEGWPSKDLYVTFRKPIDPDPERNLKAIPRKQRAMVRKGIKANLVAEIDADVDRFFRLYSESVRNLGTPVFPRRLFRVLKEEFGEACEVMTVTHDGRPLTSVLSFRFRDEVLPYYGGGGTTARQFSANDFMYWEVMRRAAKQGVRIFDYGRSKRGVGSYRFKTHWGFEPEPLWYEYYLVRADRVPDVSPLNPKYRLFVEAWKRLPLPLARLLGPIVSRNLA